jgi:hypothetical protein
MTWESDPLTSKQRDFLVKLGVADMPKTKGEGSRLIDNLLRGKHGKQKPVLKLYEPKNVNERVDAAAERARKELYENSTPQRHRTQANGATVPDLRVVGLDWSNASDEGGCGSDNPPRTEGSRGAGATEAHNNPYRGEDAAEVRARPARNDFGDTQVR